MLIRDAKEAARQWVMTKFAGRPNFFGAFFHGSINVVPDDSELSPTSDVDVIVVLSDSEPPDKPGKLLHRGALLDVSYLSLGTIQSPELILSSYHIAGSFRSPGIILDTDDRLKRLQEAVSVEFAQYPWIVRRCEDARANVLRHLGALNESAPFHDQVTAWVFGTGVTTHILLAAGLKNPTVRRRYAAVRELLAQYGMSEIHETLLDLLGCSRISRQQAEQHLTAAAEAFDAASAVARTPFPYLSDISRIARPISIDGSKMMIEQGDHREAIFWIVVTYCRCLKILYHDATVEIREPFEVGFRTLMADLGIHSYLDLCERCEQVKRFLPHVWEKAQEIIAANPEIETG